MLNGRPTLLVEEEFLIALDLQRMLEGVDGGQVLLARDPQDAFRMAWDGCALAIIDYRHTPDQLSLIVALKDAGIPVILITADITPAPDTAHIEGLPVLSKPISDSELASAVATALA